MWRCLLVVAVVWGVCAPMALAAPGTTPTPASPWAAATEPSLLNPPVVDGPVVVRAGFQLRDINEIDDAAETFEFGGVLTLRWRDDRQAFDPGAVGAPEKIYQGTFQFNEISPAWFPQVVLVNESGLYETLGVILRVQPDGASTLTQMIDARGEADLGLRRYPFDRHRLEAVFEVLGADEAEVVFEAESGSAVAPGH